MMHIFTPRALQVLALARKETDYLHNNYTGTEHMLLGLLRLGEGVAVNVLHKAGVDLEIARAEVAKQAGLEAEIKMGGHIPYTSHLKKALALAGKEAKRMKHTYLGVEHILLGLLLVNEGRAVRVLKSLKVDIQAVREEILKAFDSNATSPDTALRENTSQQSDGKMNNPKTPGKRSISTNFVAFILLFLAGLAAYWTSLNGKFLYDDTWLVGGNPFFKSPVFIFEVFRHYLFLDSLSFYYRPVQNISYMLDYWLWFSNEFGYHLSNICYHALAAFLLYLLLKALLPGLAGPADWRDKGGAAEANNLLALIVALVWVVHPIHNAAVAYVSGRADSLACDFAISAWLLYIGAGRCRAAWAKAPLYLLAMVFFVLGLCSKEIAMIWIPLFLFHLFLFNKEKAMWEKLASTLGLALAFGVYYFLHRLPGVTPLPGGAGAPPFARRVVLMLRALGDYTWLIFWPNNLHMDRYVMPGGEVPSLFHWDLHNRLEYLSTIGVAMLLVFFLMARSRLPGQRLRIFAIGWFLFGFLPISNLFPLNAQVAEHWIYMPSMGLLLFFGGCVLAMPKRCHAPAAVIALLAVVPLTIRTAYRSYEWADPERFFKTTIASGGGSTRINLNLAMLFFNAGEAAKSAGKTDEAAKDYAKAEAMMRDIVKHFPDYIPAKIDLGSTLLREHKDEEAEKILNFDDKTTAQISSQYTHTWTAAVSMAGLRLNEKKYEEALAIANDALKHYPGEWDVVKTKAKVLDEMGRAQDAIAVLKSYADTHWWHYDTFNTLAWLYEKTGDHDAAIAAYRHAALLDIHNGDPWFKIAQVDLKQGKPEDACKAQLKGLSRNPDLPTQYLILSNIYDQLNRKPEAAEALKHAEDLRQSAMAPPEGG